MADGNARDRWVRIETADGAAYEVLESHLSRYPDAKRLGYVGPYGGLEPMPAVAHAAARPAGEKPA